MCADNDNMQGNQLPSVNVCETFKYAERHDLHITDQLRQHYIEKLSESSVSESVISTCGQPQECNTLQDKKCAKKLCFEMLKKVSEKESELLELRVELRKKIDEITHLKTRERLLIEKSNTLERELLSAKDEKQAYFNLLLAARQELRESQTLLMFERKTSLVAFQELDFSRKQIMDWNEKLRLASTFSKDEQDKEDRQERKLMEEESIDKNESKSDSDKIQLLRDEIESFQNIVVSKNEQVEELQSILEIKEERVKELESQIHIFPNFLPVVLALIAKDEEEQSWPSPITVCETIGGINNWVIPTKEEFYLYFIH